MDRTLLVSTLALALAGCISAPGATGEDDGEITALEFRDLADEAAFAWDQDAQLASVFALETQRDADPLPVDPEPGNGEAPVWIYAYRTEAGDAAAFRVLYDGTVAREEETYGAEQYSDVAEFIQDLNLDSVEGLAVAAADERFASALNGEIVTLAQGAASWDGGSKWYFAAMSEGGSAVAIVDAEDGTLIDVREFDVMPSMAAYGKHANAFRPVAPVRMEEKGTLASDEREAEFPFEHAGFDGEGLLEIKIQKRFQTDTVQWKILDEGGEEVASGYVGRSLMLNSEQREFDFQLDEPGDYTLVLRLQSSSPGTPVTGSGVDYAFSLAVGQLEEPEEEEN